MKARILSSFFVISLILMVFSCTKSSSTDEPTSIPSEQAKVEMRSAAQKMAVEMNTFMQTPAMVTLMFLNELTSADALKATLNTLKINPGQLSVHRFKEIYRANYRLKSTHVDFMANPGIYQYNFVTQTFDLIEPSMNMIRLIFPANETAFYNQVLNAELTADNLVFTDSVPTQADLTMLIDQADVMTGEYNCTLSGTGLPTSISLTCAMAPYDMLLTFSGSGLNYTAVMSMKLNNVEIVGLNAILQYTSDMSTVEKVTGFLSMPPLKFDGWLNVMALQIAMSDSATRNNVAYLNTQMSVLVYQTVLNGQLGHLEFKLFTDPETGEESPQIAMVYMDGTWEWLEAILSGTKSKPVQE